MRGSLQCEPAITNMMQSNYLPPLEPIGDFRSYVCGDVVIDQTAAIAAGVLIQADQGGRVTIAAGVCIGMGTVIHAQDGLLEIGAGANLGAGVLVYGSSKIGEGACIGASSSIVKAVIAKGAIVPPCSLISGAAESVEAKEASPAIAEDTATNKASFTASSQVSANPQCSVTPSPENIGMTEHIFANEFKQSPTEDQTASNNNNFSTNNLPSNSFASNSFATDAATNTASTFVSEPVLTPNPFLSSPEVTPIEQETQSPEQSISDVTPEENAAPDIAALISVNSAQAKAYAQAQIGRYIKRLQIN